VRQIPRGFTLVEIAIAIFIITILLGSILVPLTTQVENRNYDTTQRILDQAREALVGYAAANGRFPCPASSTNNNGFEHFAATGNAGNGVCNAILGGGANPWVGFLPAATLGFTPVDANGYAVDAWGLTQNRIRYAISNATIGAGGSNTLTRSSATAGMRIAGMSSIAGAALLYVCNSGTGVVAGTNCGTAVTLTSNAPVVIWSVGPNAATGGSSVHEAQNPNPNGGSADRLFVSRTKAAAGAGGGEFDDIVTWIGSATLFNRLVAAGQLP
jgi:prepilin-type N-terminal cleavage/methylation domain-containing protein